MGCGNSMNAVEPKNKLEKPPRLVTDEGTGAYGDGTRNFDGRGGNHIDAIGEVCTSQSEMPHKNGEVGGEKQPSSLDVHHPIVEHNNDTTSIPEEPRAPGTDNGTTEEKRGVQFTTKDLPRTTVDLTDNNNEHKIIIYKPHTGAKYDEDTVTSPRNTTPEQSTTALYKPALEIGITKILTNVGQSSERMQPSNFEPHVRADATLPANSETQTKEDPQGKNRTTASQEKSPKTDRTLSVEHETVVKETEEVTPEDGAEPGGTGTSQEPILDRVRHEALEMHNVYRARHGVPPLVLSNTLNQYSQKWAKKMAAMQKLEHSPRNNRPNCGENIYYSGSTHFNLSNVRGGTSITSFYSEIKDYDYANPGQRKTNGGQIGHFTQVVWKDSKELGVGMATTTKGNMGYVYICCNYSPPGNWVGRYEQQVLPPEKR